MLYTIFLLLFFNISHCSQIENTKIENIKVQGNTIISQQEFVALLPKNIIGNKLTTKLSHDIITNTMKKKFIDKIQLKQKNKTLHIKIQESKFIKDIILPNNIPPAAKKQLKKLMKFNRYLQAQDIHHNNSVMAQIASQEESDIEIVPTFVPILNKDKTPKHNYYKLKYDLINLNQCTVEKITIKGNKNIKSVLLSQLVADLERTTINRILKKIPLKITKKFSQPKPYNKQMLENVIQNINNFYISQGFFKCKVSYDIIKFHNNKIIIQIIIQEGKKHRIGKINIVNNTKIQIPDKIKTSIKKLEKSTANSSNLSKIKTILNDYFHQQGYKYLTVKETYKTNKNIINITLTTVAVNKNFIQDIVILGNKTLQTQIFLNAISISPGEIVLPTDIAQIKSDILRLGLCKDVKLNINNNILYIYISPKPSITQHFTFSPLHWPPQIKLKFTDNNFDGLTNRLNIESTIQKSNTKLGFDMSFKKPNSIFNTTLSTSLTTNSITKLRFKEWQPYFKSIFYDTVFEHTGKNTTKTEENIRKIIHNKYLYATKRQISKSVTKHRLQNELFSYYDASGKKQIEKYGERITAIELNKFNQKLGAKEYRNEYKLPEEEIDSLQKLRFSIQSKFNLQIFKDLSISATPEFIFTYNSAPRPTKKFQYVKNSLFNNIYFKTAFGITYNNVSFKNTTPNGIYTKLAASPIFELTKKRSINVKLEAENIFKFSINDSTYISNKTYLGYIRNVKENIPYDHLFSLDAIPGFAQGGGYDIISESPTFGNAIISNIFALHKSLPTLKLAPIINNVDCTLFFAIGKLFNNKYDTEKHKHIVGNNAVHGSIGLQIGIQALFFPPIYLVFAFDIINPVKNNKERFDQFLPSVGESIV